MTNTPEETYRRTGSKLTHYSTSLHSSASLGISIVTWAVSSFHLKPSQVMWLYTMNGCLGNVFICPIKVTWTVLPIDIKFVYGPSCSKITQSCIFRHFIFFGCKLPLFSFCLRTAYIETVHKNNKFCVGNVRRYISNGEILYTEL